MAKSPFDEYTPNVGDAAPDFTLDAVAPDGSLSSVSLSALLAEASQSGRKGVIVYFYPAAMTPGCTVEACDFRDQRETLEEAGYVVVGISPDEVERLVRFRERDALTFWLASDPDNAVATAYNAYGERNVMGHLKTGVIRSTFVVGIDGNLTYAKRNVRAKGHVERVMTELTD